MRFIAVFAVIGLSCHSIPAMAKDRPVISLPKTSKWEINYDRDFCQLLAKFGSGKDGAIFELRREQPGDEFDWLLYSSLVKYDGIAMPIELTFGLNGKPIKRTGVALTMNGAEKLPVVRVSGVRLDGWDDPKHPELAPAVTVAQEAAITETRIKLPDGKRYRLETGSMGAPLAAMRTCTADLIKTWGYEPAVEETLTRRAVPAASPAKWLGTSDFPEKSLMAGSNGLVRFRLDVGVGGKPTGCSVLYRTNPDEFADLSCKLLMIRARFIPALDAAGKPVKSFYISSIRWVAGGW